MTSPILVAWNGSAEASNALRAAVPLLRRASGVIMASVAEGGRRQEFDLPATQGAEYLGLHGIKCEMIEIPQGGESIFAALRTLAATHGCAQMVMGGYGHSRLAEMLLGGVTREALTNPGLPILLSR